MKNKTVSEEIAKEIAVEFLKGIIGKTLIFELIDKLNYDKVYKGKIKSSLRDSSKNLKSFLHKEEVGLGMNDDGTYGEIIDNYEKCCKAIGKMSLDASVHISSMLEYIAELEQNKTKYEINIEIKNEKE